MWPKKAPSKGPAWLQPDPLHRRDHRIKKSPMDKIEFAFTEKQKYVHPSYRIRYWQIAVGDRVQVVDGKKRDIGKEGMVTAVYKETNTLEVDGVNLV